MYLSIMYTSIHISDVDMLRFVHMFQNLILQAEAEPEDDGDEWRQARIIHNIYIYIYIYIYTCLSLSIYIYIHIHIHIHT